MSSGSTRRTKIVATVGPACWEPETLRELISAGADVLRLNFSHSDRDRHNLTRDPSLLVAYAMTPNRSVGPGLIWLRRTEPAHRQKPVSALWASAGNATAAAGGDG